MQERKKRQHYPPPPLVTHRHHCTTMIGSVLIVNFVNWVRIIHMQTLVLSVKRGDLGAKLKVTPAPRSARLEIDILSSVLLSEDAQFAAVNWGIEDHSTTLRETYWLVKALQELTFSLWKCFSTFKFPSSRICNRSILN